MRTGKPANKLSPRFQVGVFLNAETAEALARAAEMSGVPLTQFVREAAIEKADRVLSTQRETAVA